MAVPELHRCHMAPEPRLRTIRAMLQLLLVVPHPLQRRRLPTPPHPSPHSRPSPHS